MTLIPAQPTPDQARHFAQLAQIASDDFFSELFGKRANTVLTAMFMQDRNDFSYRYASFLQVDDSPAGLLAAYTAADARAHSNRTAWLMMRHAGWQALRFLAVSILLRDLLDFMGNHLETKDFYIAMIAIYPPYRRQGHSKTILRYAQNRARAHGCSRLALDVDERNAIAIRAYQRVGFVQIAESKKIQQEGERWGLLRLVKPIEADED